MSSEHLQNMLAFHLPAPPQRERAFRSDRWRDFVFIALGWASQMFGKLLNAARLRSIIMVVSRGARAIGNRYLEAGCTQAETRAINLLKEWLSPEQLAQYESYRYFDVIGGQERQTVPHPFRHFDEHLRDRLARKNDRGVVFCSQRNSGRG